jgi:Mn-containing catalase
MFYHERELQREVTVDNPDPGFANALQQAIGGIEGEIRVAMQYMFQAFGVRPDQVSRPPDGNGYGGTRPH